MSRRNVPTQTILAIAAVLISLPAFAADDVVWMPELDGDSWSVAGDPDLGPYTNPKQQPVDFGVWQAADGTWQLWSCIRKTKCGGNTRLFHRWQGNNLTDTDWQPMGIAMMADPNFGESLGGLQAPHVIEILGVYHMFYGDWVNVCLSKGWDGKTFARQLGPDGNAGMFSNGDDCNSRDPMVVPIQGKYYCYYTAHPGRKGAVYCRTSDDLKEWSGSHKVAYGGAAGTRFTATECPHVVFYKGWYYLFCTQKYGVGSQTTVYRSKDPLEFALDDDKNRLGTLPVAAPEIVLHEGQYYIASLKESLKGIKIARMKWGKE